MRSAKRVPTLPALSLSRISPPALPKIFSRPRLQDLFDPHDEKKLFLIIAQAAQGKSTAAADWYRNSSPRPSAWLNLEPMDSDPVNFFYLLVLAFQQGRQGKEMTALLSLPSQTMGPREDRYRYREWALALFETFSGPFQLFIDGLDRLTPQAESFRFLQVLIEGLPPAARLILISRSYPPLSLDFQNLKMGGQALVLKNEDLAFTPEEIKQYAQEFHGLSLKREQAERIYASTEGWIGGIILLIESLAKLPPDSIQRHLTRGLPDRFQREAFQYFGKEAFSALTLLQQNFLLHTSILDRLEPGALRDLFPEADGQALLKELTRKNLFVQAFPDPEKGVIFRYHQLFKNFLVTLLRSKVSPEEIRKLLARVGAHYEENGDFERAINYYLSAQSYSKASSLIKQIGLPLIRKARLTDLMHWLRELPQSLIQEDPWLLLFKAQAGRFMALDENIRILKESLALFKNQGDRSGLLLGMGLLIEAEFIWGKHRPELIREAEELLNFPDHESYLYERAFLWRQIGWAHSIRGNPRRGYWACQQAYLLANQLGDSHLKAGALAHAITSLSILGEFRIAERLLQELNSFSWRFPNTEILFIHSISKVLYLIFRGEFQTALELCTPILEETEKQGLSYLYPFFLLHKQVALSYNRDHREADQISKQLLSLAAAVNNGFLKGATLFFSAISAYWSDRRADARDLIDQAIILFAADDSSSEVYFHGARLIRGLLNDQTEKRLAVIQDLREVVDYWEAFESHLFLTEGHLALGLLYRDQGLEKQAREHLQKGLKLAQQRDFRHFMIISPRDTARACLQAQEYFEAESGECVYASGLLTKKFARLAPGELEEWTHHPDPQVSQKIWGIQRAVRRADTPVLRIETFGGLRLFFDNREMGERAWDRHQPRQLLVAILSQKNDKIHKETLIEILWPEEKPGIGEKNFKTTLQRLRKSLESDISPTFGSSYIHLHHNLVSLDEELCRIDCRKFMACYKAGKEKEKGRDAQGALNCFSQAIDLYLGDFIAEDLYAPWVERRREDLKNIFLDLLLRTARYHEQAGAFKKAVTCLKQALEADPLLEEACRRLMTLYAGKNQYNEALRVFESCRKTLKAELNTRPDPATVALYQGIRERLNKG